VSHNVGRQGIPPKGVPPRGISNWGPQTEVPKKRAPKSRPSTGFAQRDYPRVRPPSVVPHERSAGAVPQDGFPGVVPDSDPRAVDLHGTSLMGGPPGGPIIGVPKGDKIRRSAKGVPQGGSLNWGPQEGPITRFHQDRSYRGVPRDAVAQGFPQAGSNREGPGVAPATIVPHGWYQRCDLRDDPQRWSSGGFRAERRRGGPESGPEGKPQGSLPEGPQMGVTQAGTQM
jgi:hypothetical protein